MLDEATLSMNILQFAGKSFDFESTVTVAGVEYAVFARTETETEAKLRPKLVRMRVVVPRTWVTYEEASDTLVLAKEGVTGAPQRRRAAGATTLEPEEFRDQGIDWKRETVAEHQQLYLPKEDAARLLSREGRALLGLPP